MLFFLSKKLILKDQTSLQGLVYERVREQTSLTKVWLKINLTCFILYWISYGNVLHVTFFSIAGRNRNLLCSYLLGRSFTENSCFRICFTQRSISEKYLEHNGFCSRSHGVSILCSREITHFWKFVALLSREVENIERKKHLNQNRPILMWTCFILATLHVCL